MGWSDSGWNRSDGGGGRLRVVLRRIFGDGEDPLSWGLPLYTAWGIRVRVHLLFVFYVLAELVRSLSPEVAGFTYIAIGMGTLFVLVLLHEYGHCVACRLVGGEADEIMLWPLGGLAMCRPDHDWRAHFWTVVGGPAVNLALMLLVGVALVGVGVGRAAVLFNPFAPGRALAELSLPGGLQPTWLVVLWWLYYLNAVLLLFNVLVPMYPMDGGRLLQALLWRWFGYERSMHVALTVGLVTAGVLAVISIPWKLMLLFALAVFGGLVCWAERQRLRFAAEAGAWLSGTSLGPGPVGADVPRGPTRAQRRREQRLAREQAELDRLLAKIRDHGMDALTRRERRWLKRTSERRRRS